MEGWDHVCTKEQIKNAKLAPSGTGKKREMEESEGYNTAKKLLEPSQVCYYLPCL